MNRREFLRAGAGSVMLAAAGCAGDRLSVSEGATKDKFAALEPLPPMMPNAVVKESALAGRNACKFVDDCIWFLRDIARMKPKSIFDTPYLGGFKKIHDATGLKVQFNMFYRTDMFYGNHEQYFFRDYFLHQPDYMEREMLVARTLRDRGYRFIFMEDIV